MWIEGEQSPLERGIPRGVKDALSDVFDFVGPPVIAAAIFRHDDVVKDGPQLLSIHPEQNLRLG